MLYHDNKFLLISLSILITCLLDSVWILLGEGTSKSLLGVKGQPLWLPRLEIISFILIILLSDSAILKLDEIRCWSLFGFKGLSRFTTKDDNLTSQVWLVSLAYCLNLEILIRCRQKFPTKLYTIPFHKEKKKDSSSRNLHRKTIIRAFRGNLRTYFALSRITCVV